MMALKKAAPMITSLGIRATNIRSGQSRQIESLQFW